MGSRDESPEWAELPPAELVAFDRWLRGHDARIEHRGWLTGGRSGSPVAVVTWFEPPVRRERLVLKFCADPDEVRRMRAALNEAPREFRARHLLEFRGDQVPLHDWWMVFLTLAGGDLSEFQPVVTLVHQPTFAATSADVVASVLGEWNPDYHAEPATMSASELVSLMRRGRPRAGGEFLRWARQSGLVLTDAWLRRPGRASWLPNPLTFTELPEVRADRPVDVLKGRAHGDLNVRNILVPRDPAAHRREYRLIDTGGYAADALLVWDPVHLLLTAVMEWREQLRLDGDIGRALMDAIVPTRTADLPSGVAGYHRVCRALYGAGYRWSCADGFGEEWRRQSLLALVAGALVFADRPLSGSKPDAARSWLFDLAAVAAAEYLVESQSRTGMAGGEPPPSVAAEAAPAYPITDLHTDGVAASHAGGTRPSHLRLRICRALVDDWRDLADVLDIPAADRARFDPGYEPQQIWHWLDYRHRLVELREALLAIGRGDLVPDLEKYLLSASQG